MVDVKQRQEPAALGSLEPRYRSRGQERPERVCFANGHCGIYLQKRLGMLLGFIDAAEERQRVRIEVRYCYPGKLPRH